MKNKKTIALAMAAVTVAPMAVPAFAAETVAEQTAEQTAETQERILENDWTGNQSTTIDVMASNGYELVNFGGRHLLDREEVFNTNGTDYTSDDTIRESLGEGAEVLLVVGEQYVVVKKTTSDKVAAAQEKIRTAQNEIEQLKKDGYTITRTNIAATTIGEQYKASKIIIQAKLGNNNIRKTFVFEGAEGVQNDDTIRNLRKLFTDEELLYVCGPFFAYGEFDFDTTPKVSQNEDLYYRVNKLKYIIESNISKFDIFMEEDKSNNKDLNVILFKKGAKGVPNATVAVIKLKNFKQADESLIIDMPSKIDVEGKWYESDVIEAMLRGHVDASATFNPEKRNIKS